MGRFFYATLLNGHWAQVFYENPNESSVDPTVMGIVQATQTAAVQAATFEPLRPTVEAILTATAEGV